MLHKPLTLLFLTFAMSFPAWGEVVPPSGVYAIPTRWIDDRTQPFLLGALQGTPTVVTMAYGACKRVCSSSLRVMEQLQHLADQRQLALNFVVVGLDPSEDKPADWAEFRADRRLLRSNWYFLSGSQREVRQIAGRLSVRYWRYGDHTMHDFRVVLLNASGEPIRSLDRVDDPLTHLLP